MMTSNIRKAVVLGFFTLGAVTGCGNGTEPLSALNDPNTIPQLTIPFSISPDPVLNITAYSSSSGTPNDGFTFNLSGIGTGSYSIFAPAPGIVTNTDGNTVTIYHNARFTTRISRINVGTTPGTVVTTATVIGTGPIANTAVLGHLQVIQDGAVVCPYFFLVGGDSTQRSYINTKFAGAAPCL